MGTIPLIRVVTFCCGCPHPYENLFPKNLVLPPHSKSHVCLYHFFLFAQNLLNQKSKNKKKSEQIKSKAKRSKKNQGNSKAIKTNQSNSFY